MSATPTTRGFLHLDQDMKTIRMYATQILTGYKTGGAGPEKGLRSGAGQNKDLYRYFCSGEQGEKEAREGKEIHELSLPLPIAVPGFKRNR